MDAEAQPEAPAGDPVCWLALVCDACGAIREGAPGSSCARCGAEAESG